jgi:hypothetical protein
LERLAAITPRPHINLLIYHGILAHGRAAARISRAWTPSASRSVGVMRNMRFAFLHHLANRETNEDRHATGRLDNAEGRRARDAVRKAMGSEKARRWVRRIEFRYVDDPSSSP